MFVQRGSHVRVAAQHAAGEHQEVMKVELALICPQLRELPHLRGDPVRKRAQRRVGEGRGRPAGYGLQFLAGPLQSAQIGPILLPTMTPLEFSGGRTAGVRSE